METPNQEWERHIEQKDWETLGLPEDISDPWETKICYYCRQQVSTDIGQVEIFCPHCQMISQAIDPT